MCVYAWTEDINALHFIQLLNFKGQHPSEVAKNHNERESAAPDIFLKLLEKSPAMAR